MHKFILTNSMQQRIIKKNEEEVSPVLIQGGVKTVPIKHKHISDEPLPIIKHAKKPPNV